MANIHSIPEKNLDKIGGVVLEKIRWVCKKFDPRPLNLKFGGKFWGEIRLAPAEIFRHKFGLKYRQGWALEQ